MDDKVLNEILQDILQAKRELAIANQNFNFASTDDMIDICTYQIIAAQRKCDYLIKKAKDMGIKFNDYLSDNVSII